MGAVTYFILGGDKLKYDPVVYDDGSVEYRLINNGRDLKRGTGDDQHWVLRFPKELDVFTYEGQGEIINENLKPFEGIYNHNLYFYMMLPEFSMEQRRNSYEELNLLRVSLSAIEDKYVSEVGKTQTSGFFIRQDVYTNRECRKETEIIPGLFKLRDPSASEKKVMYEVYGEEARYYDERGCGASDPTVTDYSFYTPSGRPIGTGNCYHRGKELCFFYVWLPYSRTAHYSFHRKYLMQIHDIHQSVINLLETVTDTEKSRNGYIQKD